MVRAPCCEKMGLKRGPWTNEEDQILISYIQKNGHSNWRALPKQAGLLRCGKSCRLRWTNYLRPDIRRGNFSKEEEEAIIKLHAMLGNRKRENFKSPLDSAATGSCIELIRPSISIMNAQIQIQTINGSNHLKFELNPRRRCQDGRGWGHYNPVVSRWSAIAARLPGRTDNEIKNVWHTHLKKKIKNYPQASRKSDSNASIESKSMDLSFPTLNPGIRSPGYEPVSPQDSSSEFSSVTDQTGLPNNNIFTTADDNQVDESDIVPQIDESYWSEELLAENCTFNDELGFQYQLSHEENTTNTSTTTTATATTDDGMDFWYNLLVRAAGLPVLPEF